MRQLARGGHELHGRRDVHSERLGPRGEHALGISYNDGAQTEDAQQPIGATSTSNALVQIFDYAAQQTASSSLRLRDRRHSHRDDVLRHQHRRQERHGPRRRRDARRGLRLPGGHVSGEAPRARRPPGPAARPSRAARAARFRSSSPSRRAATARRGGRPRSATDGSSAQTATRALEATSTTAAVLEFEGQLGGGSNPLDFGTVGVPVSQTMTLVSTSARRPPRR